MSGVYYNENNPHAAEWIRQNIGLGLIPAGDVDERSIVDVSADDLRGYGSCHFFAGIGTWAYAARLAGWPDERPIWTGSCPCQPFSVAGRGRGGDDPRHLWPHLHRLIRACRPACVLGEQVARQAGRRWFDGVRADLEDDFYAVRAIDIPACAVNAPHERSRLWWCAVEHGNGARQLQRGGHVGKEFGRACDPDALDLADGINGRHGAHDAIRAGRPAPLAGDCDLADGGLFHGWPGPGDARQRRFVADAYGPLGHGDASRSPIGPSQPGHDGTERASAVGTDGDAGAMAHPAGGGLESSAQRGSKSGNARASDGLRTGAYWADAEWLACRDGKARRAKPGVSMLVDGSAHRVSAWRGFGNGIVAPLAAEVIRAFLEAEG